MEALGGKGSKAYKFKYPEGNQYKTLAGKCFSTAEREFKARFNLRNYAELRQHQYEEAIEYWSNYELSNDIMQEIYVVNNQVELFAL